MTTGVPARSERDGGDGHDGGDDALGPEAVDAPLLNDVGLEVGEHEGEEEADLRELEDDPETAGESDEGDQSVADDAKRGDGDVELVAVCIFVEGARREDGVAGVIDGAAVELLGDGTGWRLPGVLVVDAESEDADEDTCDGEQGDQILHTPILCRLRDR